MQSFSARISQISLLPERLKKLKYRSNLNNYLHRYYATIFHSVTYIVIVQLFTQN